MVIQKMMNSLGLGGAAKKAAAEESTEDKATIGAKDAENESVSSLAAKAGAIADSNRANGEDLATKDADNAEDKTDTADNKTEEAKEETEKEEGEGKKSSGFATAMKWILGLAGVGVVIYIAKAMFFSKK
jgi:cobalamin biosynthesis Mg chelatase CobN